MTKRLTIKQKKFVALKVQDKPNAVAYREAGYKASNNNVANVESSKLLNKPNIQEAIDTALVKLNLTPERCLKVIDNGLDAMKQNEYTGEQTPDYGVQLKASGMALKLMGATGTQGNTAYVQVISLDKDSYKL
jgi:phage terminase small subunit